MLNFVRHRYSVKAKFKSSVPLCDTCASSDTEVISTRNIPSNVLQNKNQHCTGLQLRRKEDFIFSSSCLYRLRETGPSFMGSWVASTWLATDIEMKPEQNLAAQSSPLRKVTFGKSVFLNIHNAASLKIVLLKWRCLLHICTRTPSAPARALTYGA